MRTTRSRSALGALFSAVLLVGVTACSSGSDDTAGESLDPVGETVADDPAPTTVGGSDPTSPESSSTPSVATGDDDPAADPTTADVVVPAALQFSAPLVGGGTFDGAAVAGKPTVFWFWAPT